MCKKYFGVDYEHWNWEIESDWYGVTKYGIAIELPKKTIDGISCYTDPFITYSAGTTKGLIESTNKALSFMCDTFENVDSLYYNPDNI